MASSFLQATKQNKGLTFDPRTKLLLLIAVSIFVLGGLCSDKLPFIAPVLSVMPALLLLAARKIKKAFFYLIVLAGANLLAEFLLPQLSGFLYFFLLGGTGLITRVLPGITMGAYVVSTTTVSEFTAAMQRLHISDKIIIPMSVMFRFFPTIGEEFSGINAAMKMRGIGLGGGNAAAMLEYRLIPLLTCSAKIGEELSAAALTRGLGGDIRRTNICRIGFRMPDVLVIILCFAVFGLALLTGVGVL